MKIRIVTPSKNILEDEAEEVYALGPKGEFGILSGHAHYVSPLAVGRLFYEKGGKRQQFVVAGGYLEVLEDTVLVLADEVEAVEQIDLKASRHALEEVEKSLAAGVLEPGEFQELLEKRDLEQARVNSLSK
jgi:F-type H+-transporting ATPase subunit epsilon